MGCNYYLRKRDGSMWNIPRDRLGTSLEFLCKKEFDKDSSVSLSLDLKECIEQINELHIGKSSFGWHFSLCIYPILNIYTLKDWEKLFNNQDDYVIIDEEDRVINPGDMLDTIVNRKAREIDNYSSIEEYEKEFIANVNRIMEKIEGKKQPYTSYDEFLRDNHAIRGYNGLMAHSSTLWDERENEMWKDFMPMITSYVNTSGTYDLTTDWNFS